MNRKDWRYVSLPSEIIDKIDKIVNERKYGFKSRNSFVLEAVKAHLEKFGAYP